MRYCRECLARQQEIDRLLEENARLKERLRRQERTAKEEPFGASTPSSKKLVKASTPQERRAKCGGAVPGHKGHGRASVPREAAERVERLAAPCACPECGGVLEVRGERERTVHDCAPVKKTTHVCVQERLWCTHCRKSIHTKVPGVLPRSSISNNLLAQVFKWHYLEGITLGCIRRQFKLGEGTLCGRLHALAQIFEPAHRKLREHYRASAVKHADETGWRNDGANGYAWGFFAPGISLFECRNTRSGRIAAEVFGQDSAHVGTLVVDRYPAYNVFKGNIQYCYEHLKRDTLKVAEDNPGEAECAAFSEALSALLIEAMRLRSVEKDPARYREKAVQLRRQIEEVVKAPARHPSVQRIQNIFRENAQRLYHWVEAPCIPAENNLAERGLRPLVIARKISFGSQSEKGLRTRSILMSIAHTLAARTGDVEGGVCKVLDALVANPNLDVAQYLFGEDGLAKPPAVPAAPCR
jgi:transposase